MSLYFDLYVLAYKEASSIHKVYGGYGNRKMDIAKAIFFDMLERDRLENIVQKRTEIIELGTPAPPPTLTSPSLPPPVLSSAVVSVKEEQSFSAAIDEIMSSPALSSAPVRSDSIMGRHGFK